MEPEATNLLRRYTVQGARIALWRIRLALSSPTNSSLIGSHFCVRPVQVAMFAEVRDVGRSRRGLHIRHRLRAEPNRLNPVVVVRVTASPIDLLGQVLRRGGTGLRVRLGQRLGRVSITSARISGWTPSAGPDVRRRSIRGRRRTGSSHWKRVAGSKPAGISWNLGLSWPWNDCTRTPFAYLIVDDPALGSPGNDLDGAAVVHAHHPLRDIEVMHAIGRDAAAGEIALDIPRDVANLRSPTGGSGC